MAYSNSSINTYVNCQYKYDLIYNKHTPCPVPESPHLTFGSMAHDVLHRAGDLRDAAADGVISNDEYYTVIPSEILYNDLKEFFNINNWQKYFTPIIRQCAIYENDIVYDMLQRERDIKNTDGEVTISRELKLSKNICLSAPLVGVIDLLIMTQHYATIIDYKFSTSKKTQDDFDMNSQLQIYAYLVSSEYNIPLENIAIGYIDIPKQMFDMPAVLKNGTLSRAKSQNVLQDMYKLCVEAAHGKDDSYYNCNPGGYYYDCYMSLAMNKVAYLSTRYLDIDVYNNVVNDIIAAAEEIDGKKKYLKKFDSYSCGSCEYKTVCKDYLYSNTNE